MKKTLLLICAALLFPVPAYADGLSVEQCIDILAGLNALNCVGQQIGGQCDKDAKQYKLGAMRFSIAQDISLLGPILSQAQEAQRKFAAELPPIPATQPGKPVSPEMQALIADENKKLAANNAAILARGCGVSPPHIKLSDLNLGDGPDQNPIPVSVIGAILPIIDK